MLKIGKSPVVGSQGGALPDLQAQSPLFHSRNMVPKPGTPWLLSTVCQLAAAGYTLMTIGELTGFRRRTGIGSGSVEQG